MAVVIRATPPGAARRQAEPGAPHLYVKLPRNELIVKLGCKSRTRCALALASAMRPALARAAARRIQGMLKRRFACVAILAALAASSQRPAKNCAHAKPL